MSELAFGTPRKLPKPARLEGRVVVLDIAFAAASGGGFDKVTRKFIEGLGERLVRWVDHHDHDRHGDYLNDSRFVLATKAQHGACPEMILPDLVESTGTVDTIVCHTDFDGLASAAKWMNGGVEPFAGCDDDARVIDTRIGQASPQAAQIDRALRARSHDTALLRQVVALMRDGLKNQHLWEVVNAAANELIPIERETRRAAERFRRFERRNGQGVAYVDVTQGFGRIDKTELLLLGQRLEQVCVVVDEHNISMAAPFDSGVNFLELLGLEGGMPTRVSVPKRRHDDVMQRLGVDFVN